MAKRLASKRLRIAKINSRTWRGIVLLLTTLEMVSCNAIPCRGSIGICRLTKRSPLEMGSSFFGNIPVNNIRSQLHFSPLLLSSIPIIHKEDVVSGRNFDVNGYNHLEDHVQFKEGLTHLALKEITGTEIKHLLHPTNLHVVAIPLAVSNVMKTSIHVELEHVPTDDNINIPVVTHTVSHSSTNITHAPHDKLLPIILSTQLIHPLLLPIAHQKLQPLLQPVHPLQIVDHVHQQQSVFPAAVSHQNQMLGNLVSVNQKKSHSESITSLQEEETESEELRKPVGGYGVGLGYGGQGAGHGYYAFGR